MRKLRAGKLTKFHSYKISGRIEGRRMAESRGRRDKYKELLDSSLKPRPPEFPIVKKQGSGYMGPPSNLLNQHLSG